MLRVELMDSAGRTAYLAGMHAAQALIFERSDRIVKRHRGVQSELHRITRGNPVFDLELAAFLGRSYNFKAIADYGTGPDSHISVEEARGAITTVRRFIAAIEVLLEQR